MSDAGACAGGIYRVSRKAGAEELDEFCHGRADVLRFVVEIDVTGAFDHVQLLRLARAPESLDRHPRRDGPAPDDQKERARRDEIGMTESVERRETIDA